MISKEDIKGKAKEGLQKAGLFVRDKGQKAGMFVKDKGKTLVDKVKGQAVTYYKNQKDTHDYVFQEKLIVDGVDIRIGGLYTMKFIYREEAQLVREFAQEIKTYNINPELKQELLHSQVGFAITNMEDLEMQISKTILLQDPAKGHMLIDLLQDYKGKTSYPKRIERKKTIFDYVI